MKNPHPHSLVDRLFLSSVIAALLAACAGPLAPPQPESPAPESPAPEGPAPKGPDANVLQSGVPRNISLSVPSSDMQDLATGGNAFAMDFYQAVRGQDGNLFFSPYSLSLALAMTYAGARGDTASQMAKVLHFTLPPDRLHPAFNALDQGIEGQGSANSGGEQPFQLNIANSIWGQQGYAFLPAFLDQLSQNYGAGLRLVDFKNAPEPSRAAINNWVSQQTKDKIKDLIPPGVIDSLTCLVLANAIYFKGDWANPFENAKTHDAPFTLLDGTQANVKMMSFLKAQRLSYLAGKGFQAVELPYIGGKVSMLLIVPDSGSFSNFEAGLDSTQVDAILASLQHQMVFLSIPKFNFESKFNLKDTLAGMGMSTAFDPQQADFSGMDGTHTLYIGDILHKAVVTVDEKGTEAAAASAVVMEASAAFGEQPVVLTVDRPFIFLIRDQSSGAILFAGRLLNPGN